MSAAIGTWPKSAKRCRISKRRGKASHRSAIGGRSSGCGGGCEARIVLARREISRERWRKSGYFLCAMTFLGRFGETKPAAARRRSREDIGQRIAVAGCDGARREREVVEGAGGMTWGSSGDSMRAARKPALEARRSQTAYCRETACREPSSWYTKRAISARCGTVTRGSSRNPEGVARSRALV